jgi:hypothetical protein
MRSACDQRWIKHRYESSVRDRGSSTLASAWLAQRRAPVVAFRARFSHGSCSAYRLAGGGPAAGDGDGCGSAAVRVGGSHLGGQARRERKWDGLINLLSQPWVAT